MVKKIRSPGMECTDCKCITQHGYYISSSPRRIVCKQCYDDYREQEELRERQEENRQMSTGNNEIIEDKSDEAEIDRMINEGARPGGKYHNTGAQPGDSLLDSNEADEKLGEYAMDIIKRMF